MFQQVHHIGFAVYDLDNTIALMDQTYKMKPDRIINIVDRQMKIVLFKTGKTYLEYLAPLSEQSGLFTHLKEKGEGFHHIAYLVDSIEEAIKILPPDAVLKQRQSDIGDWLIADLHAKYCHGLTSQIIQEL